MILEQLISGLKHETLTNDQAQEFAAALRPAMAVAESVRCNTGVAVQTVTAVPYGQPDEYNVVITMRLTRDTRDELLCFLAAS